MLKSCKNVLKKLIPASWRHVDFLMKGIDQRMVLNQHELSEIASQLQQQASQLQQQLQNLQQEMIEIKTEVKRTNALIDNKNAPHLNIYKQIWSLAGMQTAQYVMQFMPHTKVFPDEVALRDFAVSLAGQGLYLEFGVFSGTSINQIADQKQDTSIYGFDSFEGLPETWRAGFETGMFAMEEIPAVRKNVNLIKGWFDDTLPGFVQQHKDQCAFIHIDCDLYSSTKTVFDHLAGQIKPGTILLFDEYFNYPNWQEHEHKAFQEYVKNSAVKYEYIGYAEANEQVAVRITGE